MLIYYANIWLWRLWFLQTDAIASFGPSRGKKKKENGFSKRLHKDRELLKKLAGWEINSEQEASPWIAL